MTFDEKTKEKLRELFEQDPLKGISFTDLKTDTVHMAVICTSIWEETIRKYLKKGFIPTKAYKDNIDLINKWMVVKENIEDYANDTEDAKDAIADYSSTLAKIETDPFYARTYANSKDSFAECKVKAEVRLKEAEKKLEENKRELPELAKQVAELKKFEFLREKGYV